MHNISYKSALARRVCRYSDARPPRKTDGVLLEPEIPPRMRGKGVVDGCTGLLIRITPAYAGKRAQYRLQRQCGWDHPRVCGEKEAYSHSKESIWGSPPRMRGKVPAVGGSAALVRITPACAGKRPAVQPVPKRRGDHPRICGEK